MFGVLVLVYGLLTFFPVSVHNNSNQFQSAPKALDANGGNGCPDVQPTFNCS